MTNKINPRQRSMLLHARKHGAVFGTTPMFPGSNQGGGSVRRMALRLAGMGLLNKTPPYSLTKAGTDAITMLRHDGSQMPTFYLNQIDITREHLLNGFEMLASVRTSDTLAMAKFHYSGRIEIWRAGNEVAAYFSMAEMYRELPKLVRKW